MTQSITLPKTMPAVVCHGPHDYRLDEVAVPTAGPDEVIVEVLAIGICAGDVKCWDGAPLFWESDGTRPGYAEPPAIAGHEPIGRVVALGVGAGRKRGLEIGDLAISEQIVPCHDCRFCRRGQYWMCQVHHVYGFKSCLPGGMAPYMKYPAGAIVHKVPADMDPTCAAMIEPLTCSIHAVQRARIEFGDTVVVAGCGPLGLGMVAAARLTSPSRLIALDLRDNRLEVARQMGADLTMNPDKQDVVSEVLELTEGYGCDVYIEATGFVEAVPQGLRMIRKLGRFVEFSVHREPVTVDWTLIGDVKELDIYGSHLGPYCYPLAIDYIHRSLIDVAPIVTHTLPLAEFEKGFKMVRDGTESIKVQLQP